jgi:hypothetical protein
MKKLNSANIFIFIVILFASSGFCKKTTANSNVTFYKVPLVCGAASHIGCGSKAKPILLGLEKKNDVISEAWLNRTGTIIAIVWKENLTKELQASTVNTVFKENKMDVTLISGKEEKEIKRGFENRQNWYRGTDVDKLSLEEAGVIADRLISRINSKTPLTKDKSETLKTEFIVAFKNRFTKKYGSEINNNEQKVFDRNRKQIQEDLLLIGKKYLNENEMQSLNEAISLGLTPTEQEKSNCKKGDSKSGCCEPKKKEMKGCCAKPNN